MCPFLKESSIAVILPSYNEQETLESTVRAFSAALPDAIIVIVDNASTDRTQLIARRLVESDSRCILLSEPRKGKAHAVRRALMFVGADIYVLADADMTYPADASKAMIDAVRLDAYDMVVGDRGLAGDYRRENKRLAHVFGNRLVVGLINHLFGASLHDAMSGYRVFNRRFADLYPALIDGFELEVDMTVFALMARLSIREIPIAYKDRPEGSQSKLHTVRDGWRVIRTVFNILRHYRPMYFFGGIGIILGMLGLLSGAIPIDDYLHTRYVAHVPLALLAVGFLTLSAICISTGLVLSTVARWGRMDLEQKIRKYRGGICEPADRLE